MPTTLPTLAFLGAGSMARAIIAGLLSPEVTVDGPILVTNRSAAKAAEFDGTAGVRAAATELDAEANRSAAKAARIVVIAVKPAMVPELLDEIAPVLQPGTIVVSVAAGVTTARMEAHLPEHVSVVRTMPNTPAQVGQGVTGIVAGSRAGEAELALVESLFGTVGVTLRLGEDRIDALGTISGSGPAYVFYLIEQLEAAARSLGFSAQDAAVMVRETFAGSVALLAASGEEPAELRRRVTSPNGTTERAIATFDQADLAATFRAATEAALKRSHELAQGS